MAWIELHDDLHDHKKIRMATALLRTDIDRFVGKLTRLWLWALNNREDGVIAIGDEKLIARVMNYHGGSQKLVKALVDVGLLDVSSQGYAIHNWYMRTGKLMAARERKREQNRESQRRFREKTAANDSAAPTETPLVFEPAAPYEEDAGYEDDIREDLKEYDEDDEYAEEEPIDGEKTALDLLKQNLCGFGRPQSIYTQFRRLAIEAAEKTNFRFDVFDADRLYEEAKKGYTELMVGEAIKAADRVNATHPQLYALSCLKQWSQFNLTMPHLLERAQKHLKIIDPRSRASEYEKEKALEVLHDIRDRNEEYPYGNKYSNYSYQLQGLYKLWPGRKRE